MSSDSLVGRDEVLHMARLSRLAISSGEVDLFARQFGEIIGHMNKLREVDTSGVEPMFSPLEHFSPLRQDAAKRVRTREEILANAPETDGETFIVPRIV